jgi:Peptidase family M28
MLAGRLRGFGRRAEVEPTYIHPQYATVHLLHVAIAIAGSLLAVSEPAIGFALVLFAATSAYLDLNSRFYLLRSLFFRRASQNVVSPGPNPSAPLRLVLVAHYDAGRSGYIFGQRGRRIAQRLSEPARALLSPSRVMFWGGLVPLLPILGARMAGIDADWISLVQLVPTILLIVAAFLLIDIALSETVPGAYDNASGVAAVLTAAQRLRENPPPNVDTWVVLTGSNESLGEGMRAWVRRHKAALERAVIVNVNGASYGTVHYEVSEGPVITYGLDPELVELCEALGSSSPDDEARPRPLRSPFATEALPARVRGLRAISLIGADHGLLPPTFHAHEDTPETVDPASQERMTEFVVSLARLLDRDAGRKGVAP